MSQIPVRVAKPVCQVPDDRLAPVSSLLSVDSVLVILLGKINEKTVFIIGRHKKVKLSPNKAKLRVQWAPLNGITDNVINQLL